MCMAPIGSYEYLAPNGGQYLGRIRKCGHVGESVSLGVGFLPADLGYKTLSY